MTRIAHSIAVHGAVESDELTRQVQAAMADQGRSAEVLRRVAAEVFNQRRLESVDELFAGDYVLHDPVGGDVHGPDGFRAHVRTFHDAFPDLSVEQVDQLVDGDRVTTRFVIRGTHQGQLLGIAPTGRSVQVHGTIVSGLRDGRIVEEWTVVDMHGLFRQLGADSPALSRV